MWPVSFDLTAAFRWAAVLAAIVGVVWLVGVVRRDAQAGVWAKVDAAIEKTNVAIDRQSNIDDKIAALRQDARDKALKTAQAIPAVSTVCPASKLQAQLLNGIVP